MKIIVFVLFLDVKLVKSDIHASSRTVVDPGNWSAVPGLEIFFIDFNKVWTRISIIAWEFPFQSMCKICCCQMT